MVKKRVNWYVWTRSVFAAFGGMTFGYDIGSINGVKDMLGFRQTFNLSIDQGGNGSELQCDDDVGSSAILGVVVAAISFGCLVGALLAGTFSDFFGRKIAIIVGAVLYTLGGIVQSASFFLWMIILGRIIGGLGAGTVYTVVPVYIAEIAPKKSRGRLISFISLGLTGGVLVGFVVNLVCQQFIFGWRISLSLEILIGVILAFGMIFLPETPRWLVRKKKDKKAAKVLARIHHTDEKGVEEEIDGIKTALVQDTKKKGVWQTLKLFFTWKCIERVIIGMFLQLFNRTVGINVLTYYSVTILCKINVPGFAISVVIGVLYFSSTLIGIFTVDKLGRKALLLLGTLNLLISMATAATLLLAFRVEEGGSRAVSYIVVVLICYFVFNYAYSYGPVTWVVNGEIHPLRVKGISVSLTTAVFWMGNIIVAQVTPIMLASPLQTFGTFYVLVGVHIAALLFVLLTLPETKGESLERIDLLFSKPCLERINLVYYLRCGCLWACCKRKRKTSHADSSGVDPQHNATDEQQVSNSVDTQSAAQKEEIDDNAQDDAIEYHTPL